MSGAGHGHHGEHGGGNKGIALLISVLALVLAFSETLGKAAQTEALSANIEASNLWAFFQAKTIRQTTLRTASEALVAQGASQEAARKQVDAWNKTVDRYQSEPETGEGRKELADKAWALIEEVEAAGGMIDAVNSGLPKEHIERAAAARQALGLAPCPPAIAGADIDLGLIKKFHAPFLQEFVEKGSVKSGDGVNDRFCGL